MEQGLGTWPLGDATGLYVILTGDCLKAIVVHRKQSYASPNVYWCTVSVVPIGMKIYSGLKSCLGISPSFLV